MSDRRKILRRLYRLFSEKGPNNYFYADDLPSFSPSKPEFLAAINKLLHEALISGIEGGEVPPESGGGQRLAVCLNPDRVTEVRKELLVWYRDPRFIIPAVIGRTGVVWAVASVFLP